jgi:transposase-like protein
MRDAMNKDNAKEWDSASALNDPLTDLLKIGAKALIQQAVEVELQAFLGEYAKVTDIRGRQSVVRNGYLPEREIVTGVGNLTVKIPKVRDRSGGGIKARRLGRATRNPANTLKQQKIFTLQRFTG